MNEMKRRLLDLLACPICKNYPLSLLVFDEKDEIVEGMIICTSCNRWYPIIDEIPHMLPDDLRSKKGDVAFLQRWEKNVPDDVKNEGKPFSLNS
jgi:uncharacterized protein YbaR (Trm112 family)